MWQLLTKDGEFIGEFPTYGEAAKIRTKTDLIVEAPKASWPMVTCIDCGRTQRVKNPPLYNAEKGTYYCGCRGWD